jgi:hypothetical protein
MDRLSNRYRLVDCIGTGGMSVVWLARDEVLGRDVVVKLLGPQRPGDTSSRHLIRQEALAAAGLSHPNVTTVYDYGEVNFPDGETVPFVVMEYVPGRTLSARLAEGPMPWREAVRMAAEVAAALAAAHQRGLVHRDVKPANVILTDVGAKVLDFGIAAAVGTPDEGDVLLGTPAYVAPERLAGGPVHPAADVYSVGLLLYKALTGHLPWNASTATQILKSHRWVAPAPLPDIPGMPAGVAKLCLQCLSKKPGKRPDSPDVARRLADLAGVRVALPEGRTGGDRPAHAFPVADTPTQSTAGMDVLDDDPTHAGSVAPAARPARWWQRRPPASHVALGAVAAVVLLVLVAGVLGAPGERASTTAEAPAGSRPVSCDVRVATASGSLALTVVNSSTTALPDWHLDFTVPAGLRVSGPTGRVAQDGDRVTLDGGSTALTAGGSSKIALRAAGAAPAAPSHFALNGSACGHTTLAAAQPASRATASTAGTGGGGRTGKAKGKAENRKKAHGRR